MCKNSLILINMKTSTKTNIIRVVFAFVSIVSLALAIYLGQQQYTLQREGLTTTGTVIRIIETYDSEHGTMYHPEIRFKTHKGGSITFESSVSSSHSSYRVGDEVPVIYHPDRPQDAHINTLFQRFFAFGMALIFALVFGGIAFAQLIADSRRKKLLTELRSQGIRIPASVTNIRPVYLQGEATGRYVIDCEGLNPITSKQQTFKSQELDIKPAALKVGDKVDVYVDVKNEHRYVVDSHAWETVDKPQ